MRTELDVNVFIMQNDSTSINIQKYVPQFRQPDIYLRIDQYLLIFIIIIIIIIIIVIIIIVVVVVFVVVNL